MRPKDPASRSHRIVTAAFGMLLVVLAIATVVSVEPSLRWPGVGVAVVLGGRALQASLARRAAEQAAALEQAV